MNFFKDFYTIFQPNSILSTYAKLVGKHGHINQQKSNQWSALSLGMENRRTNNFDIGDTGTEDNILQNKESLISVSLPIKTLNYSQIKILEDFFFIFLVEPNDRINLVRTYRLSM